MHEADRLANKLSVATSRVAEIMSLGESEIVDGSNGMHIIPTAIWESDHAKTYLRARTVLLRAVSYRKSKPYPVGLMPRSLRWTTYRRRSEACSAEIPDTNRNPVRRLCLMTGTRT